MGTRGAAEAVEGFVFASRHHSVASYLDWLFGAKRLLFAFMTVMKPGMVKPKRRKPLLDPGEDLPSDMDFKDEDLEVKEEEPVDASFVKVEVKEVKAEIPEQVKQDNDVRMRWKNLVLLYSVYDDALASHATNSEIFAVISERRRRAGCLNRAQLLARQKAEKMRSDAEDTLKKLQNIETNLQKAAAAKSDNDATLQKNSAQKDSSKNVKPKAGGDQAIPFPKYDRMTVADLKLMIQDRGLMNSELQGAKRKQPLTDALHVADKKDRNIYCEEHLFYAIYFKDAKYFCSRCHKEVIPIKQSGSSSSASSSSTGK